jgi:hypothetical protein
MLSKRKHVIISDKFGAFGIIIFPDSVGDLNESHKYQFNSVKFLEKQTLSQSSSLDHQFAYLWNQLNQSRKLGSRSTLKTSNKIIYVFEFLSGTRSSLEFLGVSDTFIKAKEFASLSVREFLVFSIRQIIAENVIINYNYNSFRFMLAQIFKNRKEFYISAS